MSAFSCARSQPLAWSRLIVAAGWFTIALCILLHTTQILDFQWSSESGITGWIEANQYPKQQEFFYYLAAIIGIPVIMLTGWIIWIISGHTLSTITGIQRKTGLHQVAFLHLFLLVPWLRLIELEPYVWETLAASLAFGALPFSVFLLCGDLFSKKRKELNHQKNINAHNGAAKQQLNNIRNIQNCDNYKPNAVFDQEKQEKAPPYQSKLRIKKITRLLWRCCSILTVYAVVPIIIYLLSYNNNIDGGACLFHQSEFLVPMNELLHGGIPYRDIYLQHGLLHNAWIPWLGAVLFEPTLAGLRAIMGYIAPLSLLAAYYMVLKTFRFGFLSALAASLVFLSSGIGGRSVFGLLSIGFLGAAIDRPHLFRFFRPCPDSEEKGTGMKALKHYAGFFLIHGRLIITSGFLAMMAFWHSVEVGLYTLTAGAVFTVITAFFAAPEVKLRTRALPATAFAAGAFAGFWIFGWYFLFKGALGDLGWNVWIQCAYQTETWGLAMPGFFSTFRPILTGTNRPDAAQWLQQHNVQFYLGAVTLVLSTAVLTCRIYRKGFRFSGWAPQLLLLTLAGICFYRTVLGRSDLAHAHYSIFFSTLLGLFAVAALAGKTWDVLFYEKLKLTSRLGNGTFFLILTLAVGLCITWYVNVRWEPLTGLKQRIERLENPSPPTSAAEEPIPGAGVLNMGSQPDALRPVVDYIKKNTEPDERVLDFSNQSLWFFLADRRPASRYFITAYASLPAMQREVIEDIERHEVNLIIYNGGTWFDRIDGVPQAERHPLIAEYIKDNYEPDTQIGQVKLWKRKVR